MASCSGGGDPGNSAGLSGSLSTREELKSQFSTREGVYRLLTSLELSRSSRPPPLPYGTLSSQAPSTSGPNPPLKLSFVTINSPNNDSSSVNHFNTEEEEEDDETTPVSASQLLHSPGLTGNDLLPSDPEVMDKSTTRFCFNLGKELYVYPFQGSRKVRKRNLILFKALFLFTER